MSDGTMLDLMSKSTPFAIFVLILLNVVQTTIMVILWRTVANMKEKVVWWDTFKQLEKRLERVESKQNGG